jgi:hypothetical protein
MSKELKGKKEKIYCPHIPKNKIMFKRIGLRRPNPKCNKEWLKTT